VNQASLSPSFKNQFRDVKEALGGLLFYLLLAIYLLNAIWMVWVPANDFDTMSSYLARIKLEEFGPLKETATLEIQYLFPKFFDYLHAPLLKLGYFITLPNFFLFTVVLLVLIRGFPARQAAWGILLLFFCPAILMTMTTAKNDISLGLLGFLAWYVISYWKTSWFYVAASVALIAMLVGTKWHGVVLAGILSLYLAYALFSQKEGKLKKILIALPFTPLYVYFSSLTVYLANYRDYGSLMPRPAYLERHTDILLNFRNFAVSQVLDTIEAPLSIIQLLVKGSIGPLTYGFGKVDRSILIGASDFTTCGILLLLVLLASGIVLFKKNSTTALRVAAFLCLFYCVLITCLFPYFTFVNRYYLAAYILGIAPAISLCRHWAPRQYSGWLFAFFLIFSSYAVLTNGEKRLVQLKAVENGDITRYKPMYTRLPDRDALYFNVWTGYQNIFDFMQSHITQNQSLLIINSAQGGDVPFLYPLIKDRLATNTQIINTHNHPNTPLNTQSFNADFILAYRPAPDLPHYKQVYQYYGSAGCGEVCIYQRDRTK
jgi:hypothetical protein